MAAIVILIVIAWVLFPVIGIIDAALIDDSRWRAANQSKQTWVLVQIFTGVLGAIAYFVAIRPKLSEGSAYYQAPAPLLAASSHLPVRKRWIPPTGSVVAMDEIERSLTSLPGTNQPGAARALEAVRSNLPDTSCSAWTFGIGNDGSTYVFAIFSDRLVTAQGSTVTYDYPDSAKKIRARTRPNGDITSLEYGSLRIEKLGPPDAARAFITMLETHRWPTLELIRPQTRPGVDHGIASSKRDPVTGTITVTCHCGTQLLDDESMSVFTAHRREEIRLERTALIAQVDQATDPPASTASRVVERRLALRFCPTCLRQVESYDEVCPECSNTFPDVTGARRRTADAPMRPTPPSLESSAMPLPSIEAASTEATSSRSGNDSLAASLRTLRQLANEGLISEEEYGTRRAAILDRLR